LPEDLQDVSTLVEARLADAAHGDMPRWRAALDALPELEVTNVDLGPTVTIIGHAGAAERRRLEASLRVLHPWRKGPFRLFDVFVDTEWRSDWKWARVLPYLGTLAGQRVLDVGGGNGYFGWRMLEAGARDVVGVDPTLVFCMQHRAINAYVRCPVNRVLPLRFEELPPG
jgi:tRNA (mo5U34)-methyltransferase